MQRPVSKERKDHEKYIYRACKNSQTIGAPYNSVDDDSRGRQKRIKAIRKKLRHIESLKQRPKGALDANQRAKLASENALRSELAMLGSQDESQ